jgi:hypothetical protein
LQPQQPFIPNQRKIGLNPLVRFPKLFEFDRADFFIKVGLALGKSSSISLSNLQPSSLPLTFRSSTNN